MAGLFVSILELQKALAPALHFLPWAMLGLLFVICVNILKSPIFKGRLGEWAVNQGLKSLPASDYRHFADLYLPHPSKEGTTQIDHVVVSTYGIFVIETKNYQGWIFASETQREWTQQIYRKKSRFQNPLHQNELHIKALMQCLQLPREAFQSVVFLMGGATLKTTLPDHVLTAGLGKWIRKHTHPRLTPPTFDQVISQLETIDRNTNRRQAAKAHVESLRKRHG